MKLAFALLLLIAAPAGLAQQPHEQEIQRALIQLDTRAPLAPTAGRPSHPDPEIARQLRPYERMRAAEERTPALQPTPPVVQRLSDKPLPLPGERG